MPIPQSPFGQDRQGSRHYADTKRCCAREVTPKRSNPPERKFAIAEKICEKAGSERRNVIIP